MNITVSKAINCRKSIVWEAITDFDNCSHMISAIIDFTLIHKPENGLVGLKWSETREVFGKQSSETMWITDCKDGQYYCTRAENCGAIYATKMAVEEVEKKTLLTMSFSVTADSILIKLVTSLMWLFIKKSMLSMIEKDLDDIKNFVEKS